MSSNYLNRLAVLVIVVSLVGSGSLLLAAPAPIVACSTPTCAFFWGWQDTNGLTWSASEKGKPKVIKGTAFNNPLSTSGGSNPRAATDFTYDLYWWPQGTPFCAAGFPITAKLETIPNGEPIFFIEEPQYYCP